MSDLVLKIDGRPQHLPPDRSYYLVSAAGRLAVTADESAAGRVGELTHMLGWSLWVDDPLAVRLHLNGQPVVEQHTSLSGSHVTLVSSLRPTEIELAMNAVEQAFPTHRALRRALRDGLDSTVADFADVDAPDLLPRVVTAAEQDGWLPYLVAVAHMVGPSTMGGEDETVYLERILDKAAGLQDVLPLAAGLVDQAGRVCRIAVTSATGSEQGTGFLVGPDLVLTSYHVLAPVLERRASPSGVRIWFDHQFRSDGQFDPGIPHGLARNWSVGLSPAVGGLDYAVVRLDHQAGLDPKLNRRRGWLDLFAPPPALSPGLPLIVIQHPRNNPVKFGWATKGIVEVNTAGTRLLHAVNTSPGASGSPCFTQSLELVAVHRGRQTEASGHNEAVPIEPIARRLGRIRRFFPESRTS